MKTSPPIDKALLTKLWNAGVAIQQMEHIFDRDGSNIQYHARKLGLPSILVVRHTIAQRILEEHHAHVPHAESPVSAGH